MHVLAITEQGTHVHVEGETLLLSRGDQVLRRVRLQEVQQVLLLGRVEISSGAIAVLARRQVEVVFLTLQGSFRARLSGRGTRHVTLRMAQVRRALEPGFCAAITRAVVAAKITHQRQLLLRAQRRLQDPDLAVVLGRLRVLSEGCPRQADLDRLRGLEGMAAALYFSQFGKLLRTDELAFRGRSRRPPRDPVNACLSFGYVLLGNIVESEVLRCGLDPLVGFFHQPLDGRPSLMLDVLEEFRPFVDALVLRLVNRRQLGPVDFEARRGVALEEVLAEQPDEPEAGLAVEPPPTDASDADAEAEGVYLAATGRRIFLTEFFRRLRERLWYPPRAGALELRDVVREQVYHLGRVIDGTDPEYRPFVPA